MAEGSGTQIRHPKKEPTITESTSDSESPESQTTLVDVVPLSSKLVEPVPRDCHTDTSPHDPPLPSSSRLLLLPHPKHPPKPTRVVMLFKHKQNCSLRKPCKTPHLKPLNLLSCSKQTPQLYAPQNHVNRNHPLTLTPHLYSKTWTHSLRVALLLIKLQRHQGVRRLRHIDASGRCQDARGGSVPRRKRPQDRGAWYDSGGKVEGGARKVASC